MNSHAIASELSYLVLQKRRQSGELSACALDSTHQALYALLPHLRVFVADPDFGQPETERLDLTTLSYVRQ